MFDYLFKKLPPKWKITLLLTIGLIAAIISTIYEFFTWPFRS